MFHEMPLKLYFHEMLWKESLTVYPCLNDLQISRKKADTVLISVHLICTAENFKAIPSCVWDLELSKHHTLQPFEETKQKFSKPSCFNFSYGFDVLLFDFSPVWFFDHTY